MSNATRTAQNLIKDNDFDAGAIREALGLAEDYRLGAEEVRTYMESQGDEPFELSKPEEFAAADFGVSLQPVFYEHGNSKHEVENRRAIVRDDNGTLLNIVSDRYKLVPHMDVFAPVEEALDDLGLKVAKRKINVGMGGAYARSTWILGGEEAEVVKDDKVKFTVTVRNSYNYESILGLEFGAYRLVCSNGLMAPVSVAKSGGKHMRNLNVQGAIADISAMLEAEKEVIQQWAKWAEIGYTVEDLTSFLDADQTLIAKKAQPEIVEYFSTKEQTLWEAYNAMTWFATHRVDSTSTRQALVQDQIQRQATAFALDRA